MTEFFNDSIGIIFADAAIQAKLLPLQQVNPSSISTSHVTLILFPGQRLHNVGSAHLGTQLDSTIYCKNNLMCLFSKYFKTGFSLIAFIVANSITNTVWAQNAVLKSRIAVVANETNTNIWVSDFPKKTSIVICDIEENLLTVISTNDYGAAYISLPTSVKTTVIVKTVNGEITVSNKVIEKNSQDQQASVSGNNNPASKA